MFRMYTESLFSAIQETKRGKFEKMDFCFPDFRKKQRVLRCMLTGSICGYRGFVMKLSGLWEKKSFQ
ncbi:MAG: hypothetical protein ACD_75C00653G0003 [uncultured bacterium]|nr:MAG: hypothetical protein ACD_75C00653G0003 [uncultured bacterium]